MDKSWPKGFLADSGAMQTVGRGRTDGTPLGQNSQSPPEPAIDFQLLEASRGGRSAKWERICRPLKVRLRLQSPT